MPDYMQIDIRTDMFLEACLPCVACLCAVFVVIIHLKPRWANSLAVGLNVEQVSVRETGLTWSS